VVREVALCPRPGAAARALLQPFQCLDSSVYVFEFFAQLSENFREVHKRVNLRIERNYCEIVQGMNLRTRAVLVMGLLGGNSEPNPAAKGQEGGFSGDGCENTTGSSPTSNESIDSRTRSKRRSVCETVFLSKSID